MDPRQINVIVTETGRCPLLNAGDSFTISANELQSHTGKICTHAIHTLQPQLASCLNSTAPMESASYGPLYCARGFCGTAFRAEVLPAGENKPAETQTDSRHQNERRAAVAGAMLQNLGSFMERVPPDVSSRLMRSSQVETFANGAPILTEGVRNDKLFIVGDGEVCVTRRFPLSTEDSFLAVLGVGECFGEMSLLTEQINQISVRAHPTATIYSVKRERVTQLMETSARFNLALCQMLADRLRVFLATIEDDVRPGMRGDLATIPLVDLVQALNASRRTGTLVLANRKTEGRLAFDQGRMVAAVLGKKRGEEVFYEIALWTEGHFSFETTRDPLDDTARIKRDTVSILMECARRMDEAGRPRNTAFVERKSKDKKS